MKIIQLLFLFALVNNVLQAQQNGTTLLHNDRVSFRNDPSTFNPEWAPFFHGVASGDPLEDRVIIWTRVTPETQDGSPVQVTWRVATDTRFSNVVKSGTFTTNSSRDYTVKVDVAGLEAGKTYYYVFNAYNKNSLVGKTKTTPTGTQANHLKFGVVSCSNYQAGYFTNYRHLAARNDLDAVIHLGDYIYEYGEGRYGDTGVIKARPLEPKTEIVTLADYRTRYSTYRLDTNLVRAHQQHAFITVWDDHESANNSYKDGAENHTDSTEGSWATRKAIAKQVYFEWLPIRDNNQQEVYRTIKYGNLLDLILLDTRLKGRELQVTNVNDPRLQDTSRTILGAEQKTWFFNQLKNSSARWKLVGQQVTFSEFNVGWAALGQSTFTFDGLESTFLDFWDGYPAERTQVINYIKTNNINNVVILTGDVHASFAYDVADKPVNLSFQTLPVVGRAPLYSPSPTYNDTTGAGSVAVEFVTPSITSANFDENVGLAAAQGFQAQINKPITPFPGINLGNPNPHMKYNDLIQHGYYILDVKPDSAQANWYFAPILTPAQPETFAAAFHSKKDENHLRKSAAASAPKATQDQPAPNAPLMTTRVNSATKAQKFALLGLYPNPFNQVNTLHYSLSETAQMNVGLYDVTGKLVRTLLNQRMQPGIFTLQLNANGLAQGTYVYKIQIDETVYTAKVVLSK